MLLLCGLFLTSCNRDREDPKITISSPTDNQVVSPGAAFTLTADVTDNEGLSTISFSDGGSINQPISSADFDDLLSHRLNYTVTISEDSDQGELTITINATDIEGNSASEDVTILIQ